MRELKNTGVADRLKAAAEAKKARLEKFQPKPAVTDPNFVSREARKAAEREALREKRAAEKEAARLAQLAKQEEQQKIAVDAEQTEIEAKRAARKERKAAEKAAARARRESNRSMRA